MVKKVIKYGIIVIALGICGLYTYKFLSNNFVSDKKETGDVAACRTASPVEIEKRDIGWERIKYVYLPGLEDLTWTDVDSAYVIDDVSYKVTDAKICKKWDVKWNYEVVKDEYSFDNERKVRGENSFLSVTMRIKNEGKTTYESYLNSISLHIYEKQGKKIISKELDTASLDKPFTKSFYRVVLKAQEELEVELMYVLADKELADKYYFFLDVNPYAISPTSKEQVGIFKLPLGVEGLV